MSLVANTGKLAGRTLFITGASRGIGKAIALKAAKDGANVVVAAKTADPHPKLPGTIYSAAEEIEALGGKALPCIVDVRDEKTVQKAIDDAVKKFNGIDILINNASAISLTDTANTDMKRYDLMHSINTRGTFLAYRWGDVDTDLGELQAVNWREIVEDRHKWRNLVPGGQDSLWVTEPWKSKLCLPHLKNSNHAHILNLSPPLNLNPFWFSTHVAYTMAKYGMSMCVLGMSEEFKAFSIGVNALWPMTGIATAAIEMLTGDTSTSRKPEIVSDAAYFMLCQDPKSYTGNFAIDEDVVKKAGVNDLTPYACDPKNANNLLLDGFIDNPLAIKHHALMKGSARRYHTSAVRYEKEGKPEGQIPTLFAAIGKSLSPDLVKKTQAVYQFNVKGKEEGVWHIDLKNGDGACGQGEPKNAPDATLTMDSGNFADMFAGKLKPATAFMMGKLKIKGDLQKAMKLEKMMKSLQKK